VRTDEPAINLRASYISEPGDRLSDLGDGLVLIRHKGQPDRILDRKTGQITDKPYSEFDHIGRDFLIVLGASAVAAALFVIGRIGILHWPS
jgi:hypothetical protein